MIMIPSIKNGMDYTNFEDGLSFESIKQWNHVMLNACKEIR